MLRAEPEKTHFARISFAFGAEFAAIARARNLEQTRGYQADE
jgi:hypothetical protein